MITFRFSLIALIIACVSPASAFDPVPLDQVAPTYLWPDLLPELTEFMPAITEAIGLSYDSPQVQAAYLAAIKLGYSGTIEQFTSAYLKKVNDDLYVNDAGLESDDMWTYPTPTMSDFNN